MIVFVSNLRSMRSAWRLTQEELAKRSGVSIDSIKRLEGDKYKSPPYAAVYQIAKFFKKPVEEIFWYENME